MPPAPRSNGRALARESVAYAVGLGLQRGLPILVLPVATRILGPAEFGVASAALAVGGFLSMVLALGFDYAVVRLYHDEPAGAARTEWSLLLRVQLALATVVAALVWTTGPAWSHMFDDVAWAGALQAAVLLALAQSASSTSLGVLRAARRVRSFLAVVTLQVLAGGALSLLLADARGAGGFVAGLAGGAAAAAVAGAILTYRPATWSWRPIGPGLALAIPFVGHALASWVLSLSDRVLVERFLDLENLAAYHVAYAVAVVPMLLTDAVQSAWLPRFYALGAHAKSGTTSRLAVPATRVVAALAALVVAAAPVAGHVLAPSGYDFPLMVVAVVAGASFVRVPYLLGFAALSDAKRSGVIAAASATGATVNVLLNLWLIPAFGLNGAAAATLVAYGAMTAVVVARAEATTGETFPRGELLASIGAGLAVVVTIGALPDDAFGWLWRSLFAAAAVATGARAATGTRRALSTPDPV